MIQHKRAAKILKTWVATRVTEHLNHHENDKDHSLHFNLADMKDILEKFSEDHPRYGKVLIQKAKKDKII